LRDPVRTRRRPVLVLVVATLFWPLVSCGPFREPKATPVTIPQGPPDLVVKFSTQATNEDLQNFATTLNLQASRVTAGTEIDVEKLSVYVYFRSTSQPSQQQELRSYILRSPLVVSASML
jgi:hypothetical protein